MQRLEKTPKAAIKVVGTYLHARGHAGEQFQIDAWLAWQDIPMPAATPGILQVTTRPIRSAVPLVSTLTVASTEARVSATLELVRMRHQQGKDRQGR
jgi:hypothetical protein